MLYSIAICDDEKVFCNENEKICRGILDKLKIEYHIRAYGNAMDIWTALSHGQERYDLMLLDIMMDEMDGMELARKIRKLGSNAAIIFITSNPDYALKGYDVQALHYLLKPLDNSVLEQLIAADYRKRFQNNYLLFKSGTQNLRIPVERIISLETVGRRVEITMQEGTRYCSGKLSEVLEKLPQEQFIRCHQAFAVNMGSVRELTRQTAIAVNGKEIPVSRTYSKDVQRAFLRQMRDL